MSGYDHIKDLSPKHKTILVWSYKPIKKGLDVVNYKCGENFIDRVAKTNGSKIF